MSRSHGRQDHDADGRATRPFDIVCLSANHWTSLPTSKQHLMTVLSRSHRVLYVDPPLDVFSTLGRRRRWPKFRGLRPVGEGLWVLSPVTASSSSSPDWRLAHYEAVAPRVRRAAESLGIDRPVVWTFAPEQRAALSALDPALTVYQAADDPAAMSPDPARTEELERDHVASSDVVFAVSAALCRGRESLAKVHRVPNAANRSHYSRVLAGDKGATLDEFVEALAGREATAARPDLLPPGGRPLVLFGGAAYSWFDEGLLGEVAGLRPDWDFVLVGPLGREAADARMPANVTRVGRRPYDEFPRYVAAADVCIIPWRLDRFSEHADPIVLYEYLLCGKPVVTTPFPAALERGDMVRTASTSGGFAAEIERALEEDTTAESIRARVEFGFSSTWEDRAREVESIVEMELEARGEGEA